MIQVKIYNNKKWYDITPLLDTVKCSGDYKQCCRQLEFSLVSSSNDINIPKVKIENAAAKSRTCGPFCSKGCTNRFTKRKLKVDGTNTVS